MRFVDVSRVRTRFDEPMVARDGTRLSVDVYLPADEGRYPVLITRTPYDNNRSRRAAAGVGLLPAPADRYKTLAAHGFIVVAGDVRGRGDSDGRFVPFAHEAADGADTVAWARGLTECDGRVGLFGSGYAGFAALAAATETRVDAVAAWSPFGVDGTPCRGGALRLDWLFWMHLVGGRTVQPVDIPDWPGIFRH
jgi:putative CocE/NonD family hydrolase